MNHLTTQLEKTVGKHLTNLIFGALPFVVFFAGNAVYEPIADMSGISTQATAQAVLALVAVAGGLAIWRITTLFPKSGEVFNPAQASEQLENAWVKIVEEQLSNNRALMDFYAPKADYREQYKEQAADDVDQARKAEVRQNIVGAVRLPVEGDDETTLTIQERFARSKTLPKAFTITLRTNGEAERRVEAFADNIKSSLNLYSVEVDRDSNPFGSLVTFICHTEKIEVPDRLLNTVIGNEFFEEYHPIRQMELNPSVSLRHIPIALTEDGDPFIWERHHTLIIGTTGSGKNSPLITMIRQDEDLIIQEKVAPYSIISPKDLDLMKLQQSFLIDEFAGADQLAQLKVIASLYRTMMLRIKRNEWEASLDPEERRKAREAGKLQPFKHKTLIIDEYSEFFTSIEKLYLPGLTIPTVNKYGEEEETGLTAGKALSEILAKGRAQATYLVAAAQDFNQDAIGKKNNWQHIVFLRIPAAKSQWIDAAFGAGAKDSGVRPDLIPNLKNNASAGIAFLDTQGQGVSRVRFPYTSNEEFDALVERTFVATEYTGPTDFPEDI